MARNKHSAALFEVIRTGAKTERPAVRLPGIFSRWRKNSSDGPASHVSMTPVSSSADPTRVREFNFRLSYPAAAIFAFCFMIIIVGAYVIGRNSAKIDVPVLSASIDDLRNQPAQPDVLDVPRSPLPAIAPPAVESLKPVAQPIKPETTAQQPKTWSEPKPPTPTVVTDAKRIVGLNYVVMQSYPSKDMAIVARDTLIKYGIDATIEQGLPGLKNEWYSVVGTTGFDKVTSAEYEAYARKVTLIGERFAGPNKFYQFGKPLLAQRWRAGNR